MHKRHLSSLLQIGILACCSASLACLTDCGGSNNSGGTFAGNPHPVPTITSLSPTFTAAGGSNFTLTVNGVNFVPGAEVLWNGSSRPSSLASSIEIQAQITAADIASVGSASVTVFNPSPGGGTSGTLSFKISTPFTLNALSQTANDLIWDPVNQVIYLSVPGTAAANGNTIAVLNPTTGAIILAQFAGSNPDVLANSGDSSFLYAGIDGDSSVQRFTLPNLVTDISYPLGASPSSGPYFALDLQVAPGAPRTTAVTLGELVGSPTALGGITIFDDATARPTMVPGFDGTGNLFDSLQWGSDATALFAANNEDDNGDFYTLSVNSSGAVLDQDFPHTLFGPRIHFSPDTTLIYCDDGHVINPSTGSAVGDFNVFGVMVPDSSLNAAFFLDQTQDQLGSQDFTIQSFDLTHFTAVDSIVVPNVSGNPLRLIRWGTNGLAFNTSTGAVYLVQSSFVGPVGDAVRSSSNDVQRTWKVPPRFSPAEQKH